MKQLNALAVLLLGLLTPVLTLAEGIQSPLLPIPKPLGLEIGGDAPRKPSDPSPNHPDNPSPTPPSNPPPPGYSSGLTPDFAALDSDGCCDCRYECLGLGSSENPIDFGDSTPTTINSWNTSPFNADGCFGHSYTAFNLYGVGYGRWGYDHSDIDFYLKNQYDDPTGKYVIQVHLPFPLPCSLLPIPRSTDRDVTDIPHSSTSHWSTPQRVSVISGMGSSSSKHTS
ncbi:uncharacterized protein BP5553_03066 [Venustampulla echinocandica]|uniref:Uncharacterized protein n=1 Tax=Venustampulla echinocandica TaxID=2656787 RepID=A0A370TT65_9HELO|nr:uncharacterized protein BP5553_03066 [Venustampulla echinocandica]RDL38726.1 hypothetical protein BP5553_03066 [Venustampulla echinocandica]